MLWASRTLKLNKFYYWKKTRCPTEIPGCAYGKILQCNRIVYLDQCKQVWINFPGRYETSKNTEIYSSNDQPCYSKQSFLNLSSLSQQPLKNLPRSHFDVSEMREDEEKEVKVTSETTLKKLKLDVASADSTMSNSVEAMSAYYVFKNNESSEDVNLKQDAQPEVILKDIFDRKQLMLNSMRYWEKASGKTQNLTHCRDLDFTIMSYNILAQNLLMENRYLYPTSNAHVLSWEYRSKNLVREIVAYNADVLCFQEMESEYYENFFNPQMKAVGFSSLYKKRTGNKNDGCAIFYRTSRFHLEAHKEVEYRHQEVRMLDRDNIGLIAILKPILDNGKICSPPNDPKLCVATTHLLFNPRRGDIKLAQLQIILAELDRLAFKGMTAQSNRPVYHPTILCGDMNSEPFSPLYRFLTQGTLIYEGIQSGNVSGQSEGCNRGRKLELDELKLTTLGITSKSQYQNVDEARVNGINPNKSGDSQQAQVGSTCTPLQTTPAVISSGLDHAFNFRSAYQHYTPKGDKLITTEHAKANCTVDYIFFSRVNQDPWHGTPNPLTLQATYKLLSDSQVKKLGGLPNEVQSSDHTSLLAKFSLKVPSK